MRQFNQKTHALRFELGGKIRVAAPLGEVVPEIEDKFVYAIRDMGLPLAMTQAEPPEHWRSAEEAEAKAKADAEKAEAKRMKSEAKTKADEDAAAAKVKADAEAETERQVMESEKAKAEAEAKAKADAEAPKKGK